MEKNIRGDDRLMLKGVKYVYTASVFNEVAPGKLYLRLHQGESHSYGQYLGTLDREIHMLHDLKLTKEEAINIIAERSAYIANMFARGAGSLTIISDHDVLKDGDKYHLAHGPCAFSKLAFLLIANRI